MPPLSPAQTSFRQRAVALAQKIAPDYGLDWRLMAAAAILESGWGESVLARRAQNYFGIQAVASTPDEKAFVLQTPGGPARFRKFAGMEEAFHAYGRLLSQSRHYANARAACARIRRAYEPFHDLLRQTLLNAFIQEMAPVYCPGDPDYESKILQVVELLTLNNEDT